MKNSTQNKEKDVAVCIECRRFHYEGGWNQNLPERLVRGEADIKAVYTVCDDCKAEQTRVMCPACRILNQKRA